jgi:phage terminase large subunit-like protein
VSVITADPVRTAPDAGYRGLLAFADHVGLNLEPFQRRIVKAVFGPEPEALILVARGAGKTTLMGLVVVHHLLTIEDAKVYVAASSKDQARILYEAAATFARRVDHPNVVHRHLELRFCPDPDEPTVFTRYFRVLPAEGPRLHGLSPSLMVWDEAQAVTREDVYPALASALHKTPGSKLVTITTAGQGVESPLGQMRTRALALPSVKRRGALTEARGDDLVMLEWSVPADASVDDMRQVRQANPAGWLTTKALREQRKRLPDLAYRRFVCNQWTERQGHWLPPGSWQRCVGNPEFIPGEKVHIGVDVGGERSSSAVAWVNERLHVGVEIFHGEAGVLECVDLVRELAGTYQVVEVAFDPWRFGQAAQELAQRGIRVVEFPQHDGRMIPASQRLHAAIVERRITLPDNRELAKHAADTIARHSRRGWRVDKPTKETNIDAIVALCMAVDRASEPPPKPPEFLGFL